jgi:hypothetical protein
MTEHHNVSPQVPEDRLDGITSIWVLALGLLVVIEIGSWFVSYQMVLAALH